LFLSFFLKGLFIMNSVDSCISENSNNFGYNRETAQGERVSVPSVAFGALSSHWFSCTAAPFAYASLSSTGTLSWCYNRYVNTGPPSLQDRVDQLGDLEVSKRIYHLGFKGYSYPQNLNGVDRGEFYHPRKEGPRYLYLGGDCLNGISRETNCEMKLWEAETFQDHMDSCPGAFSDADRQAIKDLIQHRRIVNGFAQSRENPVKLVSQSLGQLLSPAGTQQLDDVLEITTSDGNTVRSFLIPIGWKKHALSLEIQKIINPEGNMRYEVVLRNTGIAVSDPDLHLGIFFEDPDAPADEITLCESRFSIDPSCLKELCLGATKRNLTREEMINHLKTYLLPKNKIIPELVKQLKECRDKKIPITDDMIRTARPYLQSTQLRGTCGESSQTGAEKRFVPKRLRRKLKIFALSRYEKIAAARALTLTTEASPKKRLHPLADILNGRIGVLRTDDFFYNFLND
jgi:hypothetical protein